MIESPKSLTEQLLNLTERIASETRAVYNKIGNPVRTINGEKPDDQGAVVVDAVPPAITVSAVTLAAGATASVEKSGTDKAPVFTFGIPQGEKGDTGPQGEKGEKGEKGDTGPQGPAGALSEIGEAILASSKQLIIFGTGNISDRYAAVRRDAYGRVVEVGAAKYCYDCDCSTD